MHASLTHVTWCSLVKARSGLIDRIHVQKNIVPSDRRQCHVAPCQLWVGFGSCCAVTLTFALGIVKNLCYVTLQCHSAVPEVVCWGKNVPQTDSLGNKSKIRCGENLWRWPSHCCAVAHLVDLRECPWQDMRGSASDTESSIKAGTPTPLSSWQISYNQVKLLE